LRFKDLRQDGVGGIQGLGGGLTSLSFIVRFSWASFDKRGLGKGRKIPKKGLPLSLPEGV
jgi:hypothetical protein